MGQSDQRGMVVAGDAWALRSTNSNGASLTATPP